MATDPLQVLTHDLRDPDVPTHLEHVVMARIARLDPGGRREEQPQRRAAARHRAVVSRGQAWRDVLAWTSSIVGLVLFVAAWIFGQIGSGAIDRALTSPEGINAVLVKAPIHLPALAGLAMGAALFVWGLFAPLRHEQAGGS